LENDFLSRHRFFRCALFVVVAAAVFWIGSLQLKASREYGRATRWPVTAAKIASSHGYVARYSWSDLGNKNCAKLTYSYVAMGQQLEATNTNLNFVCWPDGYDFAAQHPAGTAVQIAYDPSNPFVTFVPSSVRDPGFPWGYSIFGTLFGVAALVDLISLLFRRRPKNEPAI
jgi:hypothetical protein